MDFNKNNKRIELSSEGLKEYFGKSKVSSKICILIHGLTNNETIWSFSDGSDYGSLLKKDLDYNPFYLRYNTGLHISENGKLFSEKMQQLVDNYPVELEEITLIAHSMGGLVTHSACYYALLEGFSWTKKSEKYFLLATPHFGSFGKICQSNSQYLRKSTQLAHESCRENNKFKECRYKRPAIWIFNRRRMERV